MEKISYVCNEKELNYAFPARKWYHNKKKARQITLLLYPVEDYGTKGYVGDIFLTIREDAKKEIQVLLSDEDMAQLFLAACQSLPFSITKYQELIIFDGEKTNLIKSLLPYICQNLNKMTIVTEYPCDYQEIAEQIFDETGLIVDFCTYYEKDWKDTGDAKKEKPFYKRQKYLEERTFILFAGYHKKIPIHFFFKGSTFFNLNIDKKIEREITVKRADIQYFSIAKFLDTIVKLRYNTVVKEGNMNQIMIYDKNKKYGIKRKG